RTQVRVQGGRMWNAVTSVASGMARGVCRLRVFLGGRARERRNGATRAGGAVVETVSESVVDPNVVDPSGVGPNGGLLGRESADVHAVLGEPRQRVDLLAPVGRPDLEVQVRAGRLTLVAHEGDLVARLDPLALGHREAGDVAVDGDDAVVTLHLDPLAEPAGGPGLDDRAVDGRDDRGADAVREVDAVVGGAP